MKYFKLFSVAIILVPLIGHPAYSQLDGVEISFTQYQENYHPLTYGDTIFGLDEEKWGENSYETKTIDLNPEVIIPGFEDRPFDELIIVSSGGSGMINFNEDSNVQTLLALAPGSPLYSYSSPLLDQFENDQGYVIYQRDSGFIRVEYQNVALAEELYLGFLGLVSRFNFQIEYRESDARVRFIYGPSSISSEAAEFIKEEYLLTYFGFEEYILDLNGQWDDFIDVNSMALYGLAEDPSIFIPQSADFWPPGFSLVNFPIEGNVYEFNLSPPSNTKNLAEGKNWVIYPNPARDYLHIYMDSAPNFDLSYEVKIFNTKGELQTKNEIFGSGKVDIRSLEAGTYMVQLSSNGKHLLKKMVKQ